MSLALTIARRYLFAKKSTNAINIISGISVVGVAVATMALVVTLSVFNGFHDLVASLFTSFDPQLKITPVKGKTIAADDTLLTRIKKRHYLLSVVSIILALILRQLRVLQTSSRKTVFVHISLKR